MAGPITWRNVNGPSLADASRPLQVAQQSFDRAFDKFGGLINQTEAVDAKNWDTQKVNNTQSFLDALNQPKTPEELAALQKSGFLDQMRAGFGAQVDQAAIRGAADARLDTLYKQNKTAAEYGDFQLDREQAPAINDALGFAARGDAVKARQILDAVPNLRNRGKLEESIVSGDRSKIRFDQEQKRFVFEEEDQKMQRESHNSSMATQSLSREATSLNLQQTREQIAEDRAVKAMEARLAAAGSDHLRTAQPGASDTDAADRFLKTLRSEGVTPRVLARLTPQLELAFNSGRTPIIGNDAATQRVENARADWYKANGIAAPGSIQPMRNLEELAGFVGTVTKDPKETNSLNQFVSRWSRQEFSLPGGDKIPVPEQVLKAAILESQDSSWFGSSNRGDSAEKVLKRMMKDPRILKDIEARKQLDAESIRKQFADEMKQAAPKKK